VRVRTNRGVTKSNKAKRVATQGPSCSSGVVCRGGDPVKKPGTGKTQNRTNSRNSRAMCRGTRITKKRLRQKCKTNGHKRGTATKGGCWDL